MLRTSVNSDLIRLDRLQLLFHSEHEEMISQRHASGSGHGKAELMPQGNQPYLRCYLGIPLPFIESEAILDIFLCLLVRTKISLHLALGNCFSSSSKGHFEMEANRIFPAQLNMICEAWYLDPKSDSWMLVRTLKEAREITISLLRVISRSLICSFIEFVLSLKVPSKSNSLTDTSNSTSTHFLCCGFEKIWLLLGKQRSSSMHPYRP
ncbi:hypothetical protein C4D60_Mb01t12670 [Musa balbisiana]|uniref:Uncharacterized protein n=1 Tax=Musa balbisiana TaxID=52838 RepID=A0A4S8JN38_MUSBA|nr:hypothetical protein C4D60_Mb01t12670 [Musa balbisiana]